MDELNRIEKLYGSVQEYNRSVEEKNANESESRHQRNLQYKFNSNIIENYIKNGHIGIQESFCPIAHCLSCKMRTSTYIRDELDDIGLFFCLNEECKYYKAVVVKGD